MRDLRSSHDLRQVLEAICARRSFVISSHVRPDGDAIGSMAALGMVLRQFDKQVELISADPVPIIYSTLPGADQIRVAEQVEGTCDAVILLECDGIARSRLRGIDNRFLINIDHHVSGRNFADINWIDTEACAVAEMVYQIARSLGAFISPEIASCLYTSVLTDTGSFCYQGTDAHTFEIARELVRQGADPVSVATRVYFNNPASKMLLLGAALSNLNHVGPIAWLWITQDDMARVGAVEEDCEGIVNYAISVADAHVAVFFRELSDKHVRLSIRSKSSNAYSAAAFAERFGGGGHESASGCTVNGTLPEVMDTVLNILRVEVALPATESIAEHLTSLVE